MRVEANMPAPPDDDAVRLCLIPGTDYSDLASLFNDLDHRECYRVCIDVGAVSHLGAVEFRVLGCFAESFKRHGGFLQLENASAEVAALVRDFGCTDLMAVVREKQPVQRTSSFPPG